MSGGAHRSAAGPFMPGAGAAPRGRAVQPGRRPRGLMCAAALVLTGALPGCQAAKLADGAIRSAQDQTQAALERGPVVSEGAGSAAVRRTGGRYFGAEVFQRQRGAAFPPRFDKVLVRSAGEVDVRGFAALITRATGVPVALNVARQQAAGGAGQSQGQTGGGAVMPVLWDGPLAGLLDLAAAKYGVAWEYRDGVIALADERTETFVIHALPATSNIDAAISTNAGEEGGSGSGSSGAGSTGTSGTASLDAAQKASLDVWKDLAAAIAVVVGDRGRFAVTPSNGTVTVTASPAVIGQVAQFVRAQNEILTREVFVRVQVYAVDENQGDDAGLSFDALFRQSAGALGLRWQSPGGTFATPVGTFTSSIVTASANPSQWAGSSLIARALATSSRSSLVTELTLSALNNRPVTKQDVRTQSYVERTSVTEQERSTTTEITPARLSTGFAVSVLPRIISENRVLMGYSINLSSLVGIEKVTAGNVFVQLPTIDSSGSLQETMLRSGQILVLMGYMSDKALDRREGTGVPDNFLLGGTRSAAAQKKRVVITMEPLITSEASGS